jgi:hypothetical protein
MGFWTWLFGSNEDGRDRRQSDVDKMVSPAMPMAGAGAELSGESENSEPEEDLKRAAENDRQVDKAVAMTFPASDPIAAGETTSTEPPKRPTDRKPPVIRREEIEHARRGSGRKRN